jgi:hypothetical protein
MDTPEFQYELVRVQPAEAVKRCLELRLDGRGTYTPVILDSPERYFLDADEFSLMQADLLETLATAKEIDVEEFLAERRKGNPSLLELEQGEWPVEPFVFKPYLAAQAEEDLFITKVPTSISFEALAHIGFGGWNDCPLDEEHVAILRYWHERYGAELLAIGPDFIECTVSRPPTTEEAALALARQQLAYAPGSLDEFSGTKGTIPAIAAALLQSKHWLFAWD